MITYILIAVAAAIAVFIVLVALKSGDFRITRSATLPAPASVVFDEVNDFHHWQEWSPWAKLDPTAKNDFAGPDSGAGAAFHWLGNNKVGEGRMTIEESRPSSLIRIKLEFLKPFKATNEAMFTFEAAGDGTLVTWTMTGKNNFMAKIFVMFMNCDKMVGGMFEQGLSNLKSVTSEAVATR